MDVSITLLSEKLHQFDDRFSSMEERIDSIEDHVFSATPQAAGKSAIEPFRPTIGHSPQSATSTVHVHETIGPPMEDLLHCFTYLLPQKALHIRYFPAYGVI